MSSRTLCIEYYHNFDFDHDIKLIYFNNKVLLKEDGFEGEYTKEEAKFIVEELLMNSYEMVNILNLEILVGGKSL